MFRHPYISGGLRGQGGDPLVLDVAVRQDLLGEWILPWMLSLALYFYSMALALPNPTQESRLEMSTCISTLGRAG